MPGSALPCRGQPGPGRQHRAAWASGHTHKPQMPTRERTLTSLEATFKKGKGKRQEKLIFRVYFITNMFSVLNQCLPKPDFITKESGATSDNTVQRWLPAAEFPALGRHVRQPRGAGRPSVQMSQEPTKATCLLQPSPAESHWSASSEEAPAAGSPRLSARGCGLLRGPNPSVPQPRLRSRPFPLQKGPPTADTPAQRTAPHFP